MQLPRFVGVVDLGITVVLVLAVMMPAREMYASQAMPPTNQATFRCG